MQLALRPRVAKRAPSPDQGSEEDDEDQPPTRRSRSSRPRSRRQRTSAREAPFEGEDEEGEAEVEPRQLVQGTAWLAEEDHALRNAVEKHGTSWKKIEYDLSRLGFRRSTAMCRNRYQRMCAPSQEGKEGRNRCKRCGQIKRGHTCTAETGGAVVTHKPARVAPMLISPALVPSRRRPGQGGAGKVDMGLPDLSIVPPAAGNDFKVDVDDLASYLHGVPPEKSDSFIGSLNFSLEGLESLSASFSFGGALDEATPVPTKTASNDSSTYLTSAAPPPIAPKMPHTSRLPLPNGSLVATALVTTTFDEEFVELSDLNQAAEDALKSRSVASFGATPPHTTLRVADAAPVGGSREEDETPTLPAEGEEEEKIDAYLGDKKMPAVDNSYRTTLNEEEKKLAVTERMLRTPPPGLTEHPFDEPLRAETPTSTPIGAPVILPVFSTPSMHTSYGAPPLVPLPSWSRGPPSFSRAPSFSFADNNQAPYLAVPPVPPSRSTSSA